LKIFQASGLVAGSRSPFVTSSELPLNARPHGEWNRGSEIRRRRGLPERDEDEIAASVQRHREELREQARRYADPGA